MAAPGFEAYSTAIIVEMLSGQRLNHRAHKEHRRRLKEIALLTFFSVASVFSVVNPFRASN
jgi:hypothetical protein